MDSEAQEKIAEWLRKYCPKHNCTDTGWVIIGSVAEERYRQDATQILGLMEQLGDRKLPGGEPPILTVSELINAAKGSCRLEQDVAIAEKQRQTCIKWIKEAGPEVEIDQIKRDLINELKRRAEALERLPVGVQGTERSITKYIEGMSESGLRDWHSVIIKPPTAPTVKEPWQMTEGEWLEHQAAYLESRAKAARPGVVEQSATLFAAQKIRKGAPETLRFQLQEVRKGVIEQALAKGKPVPAEVLKDYPDLKPPAEVAPPEVEAGL